jgi:hypothetical protein
VGSIPFERVHVVAKFGHHLPRECVPTPASMHAAS